MINKALCFQNIILGPYREFVEASFPTPLHPGGVIRLIPIVEMRARMVCIAFRTGYGSGALSSRLFLSSLPLPPHSLGLSTSIPRVNRPF